MASRLRQEPALGISVPALWISAPALGISASVKAGSPYSVFSAFFGLFSTICWCNSHFLLLSATGQGVDNTQEFYLHATNIDVIIFYSQMCNSPRYGRRFNFSRTLS